MNVTLFYYRRRHTWKGQAALYIFNALKFYKM